MRQVLAGIGVMIGLVGCSDATAPNQGSSTVAIDHTQLVRGQPLRITVTVRGDALQGSATCLTGFSILDSHGAIVAPTDQVCSAQFVTEVPPPGGLVREFTWTGNDDGSVPVRPLPAGRYQIVGGTGPSGRLSGRISPPVVVDLVDPQ